MREEHDPTTLDLTRIKLSLGQVLFVIGISLGITGTLAISLAQLSDLRKLTELLERRITANERAVDRIEAYQQGKAGLPLNTTHGER